MWCILRCGPGLPPHISILLCQVCKPIEHNGEPITKMNEETTCSIQTNVCTEKSKDDSGDHQPCWHRLCHWSADWYYVHSKVFSRRAGRCESDERTKDLHLIQAEEENRKCTDSDGGGERRAYKIDFSDLQVTHPLGEGSFGIVYRGEYRGADVAMKKLKFRKVALFLSLFCFISFSCIFFDYILLLLMLYTR